MIGSTWGVSVAITRSAMCNSLAAFVLQLNVDLLLNEDVGAGPLMFDTTANIKVGVVVEDIDDVDSEDVEFASRVTVAVG